MEKIDRITHRIDAEEQSAGRLATRVANLLMGKMKPNYLQNVDRGDIVEIANIKKLKFTGKKMGQKKYYHYSGYPGGLKERKIKNVFDKNPEQVLHKAVYNMLPKNKLRQNFIKRLKFI